MKMFFISDIFFIFLLVEVDNNKCRPASEESSPSFSLVDLCVWRFSFCAGAAEGAIKAAFEAATRKINHLDTKQSPNPQPTNPPTLDSLRSSSITAQQIGFFKVISSLLSAVNGVMSFPSSFCSVSTHSTADRSEDHRAAGLCAHELWLQPSKTVGEGGVGGSGRHSQCGRHDCVTEYVCVHSSAFPLLADTLQSRRRPFMPPAASWVSLIIEMKHFLRCPPVICS